MSGIFKTSPFVLAFGFVLALTIPHQAQAQQVSSTAQTSRALETQQTTQPRQPSGYQDEGIGIGVEALAGFPSFSNVNSSLEAKTSYAFGLWVGGNRSGRVGFTGEFLYLVKKETLGTSEAKHKALEIPAVLHLNLGSRNKNNIMGYGVLGPVFTINVKDELTGGLAGNNFSSADVGLMYGAGVEFARISVEGRINQGLKTVTNNGGGVFVDSKARTFELVGKVRFN